MKMTEKSCDISVGHSQKSKSNQRRLFQADLVHVFMKTEKSCDISGGSRECCFEIYELPAAPAAPRCDTHDLF